MASFPSVFELRCAGISWIVSQILLSIAFLLHGIDFDTYNATTPDEVNELHEVLSSAAHRAEVETACGTIWVAFPFLLVALFGTTKFLRCVFEGHSAAEMLVYMAEKSYIMFIAVGGTIFPALSLVTVSYEWSFEGETGHYIQLSALLTMLEIGDCIAVADATFMLSLFLLPRFVLFSGDNNRLQQLRAVMAPRCCRNQNVYARCCGELLTIALWLSLAIMFAVVLFEFAEDGFFSPFGYARFLVMYSVVLKVLLGFRLIFLAGKGKYEAVRGIFKGNAKRRKMLGHGGRESMDMNTINTQAMEEQAAL